MNERLTVEAIEAIRKELVRVGATLINIPYEYGAEWTNRAILPKSLDCSEMIEGIFSLANIPLPDGSQAQYNATQKQQSPRPGDLAFFGKEGNQDKIYHVGMVFDDFNILEARAFDPKSKFETGKVILRVRTAWEGYKNFCGYRVHPKLVEE